MVYVLVVVLPVGCYMMTSCWMLHDFGNVLPLSYLWILLDTAANV